MALGRVLRTLTFTISATVMLVAAPAMTPGPAAAQCCQCAQPTTCGPPNGGQCAQGCQLLAGQRCDGRTGQCQQVAGAAQTSGSNPRRPTGQAARTGRTKASSSTTAGNP